MDRERRQLASRSALLVACMAALATPALASAAPADRVRSVAGASGLAGAIVPGEAIVRFAPGTGPAERLAARRGADVGFERSLKLPQAQVVAIDGGVVAAVEQLERQPGVAYAQPNYRYRALAVPAPDDTFFGDLWGLHNTGQFSGLPGIDVGALGAWETTRGEGQVVAVLDTGVDLTHPDMAGNLWNGPGGVHGHDFVDGDSNPDDFDYHGTHVAGTIAAIDDDGLGVAGVAPDARIMAVRVLDGDGSGSTDDIADGIEYASDQGADVVNLSLGGPAGGSGDQMMEDAIAAVAADGTVVVAAAGNSAGDNDDPQMASTPCALPNANLICVAAVTPSGGLAPFSSYGATTVDVGAPGSMVLSAKTDYGTLLTEGFDSGIGSWTVSTQNGGVPWGPASISGNPAATDSPGGSYGNAVNPDEWAESQLVHSAGLDLTSERGCRMHFRMRYDVEEDFDEVLAGAVASGPAPNQDVRSFTGAVASMQATEVSISDVSGRSGVKPAFALFSDEDVNGDGADVDDVQLLCRSATYADSKAASGNYVFFQGTSMATPHVAGVVALVRAAALEAGEPADIASVVAAVRAGVTPLSSMAGKTVTGGMVDAELAIEEALGGSGPDPDPDPEPDPAPGDQPSQPDPVGAPLEFTRPAVVPLLPSVRVNLRRARVTVRGNRIFAYRFRATPGLRARVAVRTRVKAVTSTDGLAPRRRHLAIARRQLVVPSDGRAALRVRLTPRQMRILRLNRHLRLRVNVTVRSSDGRSVAATRRLLLSPPPRP
jgi:thermitase